MNRICILIPYFGHWPQWFDLFLSSCGRNPTIEWVFFGDSAPPETRPPNTRFITMSWTECVALIRQACPFVHGVSEPYKLCDFKFAYGDIFKKHIPDCEFIGFGDIDVIYGNLRTFLTANVLRHDLVTFNVRHISGHLTLLRNRNEIVSSYKKWDPWRAGINADHYQGLDEDTGYYGIENVYVIESFNTPLSPYTPWTDGSFSFPYAWYYRDGRLFTNIDGEREFMYLHFMRYKFLWRERNLSKIVHFRPNLKNIDWKLLIDGFHSTSTAEETSERGKVITITPARSSKIRQVPLE